MRKQGTIVVVAILVTLALTSVAAAKEARAEFKVTGMSCGACAKGVEARLAELAGVTSAEVSYEESAATIVYDDTKVTVKKLKETIEQSGFKAEPKAKKQKE